MACAPRYASGRASVGLDVGSTTVKTAVLAAGKAPRTRYARHHGRPLEALAALLEDLPARVRVAVTGSGGGLVTERAGTRAVHEVTAALHAARRFHPHFGTMIDLGGQDAKLVVLGASHGSTPLVSMNDRCAAGTGVTLDRCFTRLALDPSRVGALAYDPSCVETLSARCGVFAETDLVNLARRGVAPEALVVSLADALVRQCLTALARGVTPRPPVLLLGGPHVALPVLVGAWRHRLQALWAERGVAHGPLEEAVFVPASAGCYPALGAALLAQEGHGREVRADAFLTALRAPGSVPDAALDQPFEPRPSVSLKRPPWPVSEGSSKGYVLGVDAGSTVTKAAVLDRQGRVLWSHRRPSGDPSGDARELLTEARAAVAAVDPGAPLGPTAVTGYGASWLGPLLGADLEVVETVAHARSAREVAPRCDVVCDVGGQDCKVLALETDGAIRDFWVSSQCSSGLGMVLEATARELGLGPDLGARAALRASRVPRFGDGCVVFLDADRVSLQRQGFLPEELLGGLCRALPRVVFGPVLQGTTPEGLGRTFVLQGGVQRHEAALRAQAEHLAERVPGARVLVHPYPEFAGALGAALLARGISPRERPGRLPVVTLHADPEARCDLCENHCPVARIVLEDTHGARSLRVGHGCEAGAEPEHATGAARRRAVDRAVPDLFGLAARELFRPSTVAPLRALPRRVRLGMPRVLAQYRAAPLFRGYLAALGLPARDLLLSPPTTEALAREGAGLGSTDPCFPVKVSLAHVKHLLHGRRGRLDALFLPRVTRAVTPVRHAVDCASCPVVAAAPAMVRAAFFEGSSPLARDAVLLDPELSLAEPGRLAAQLHEAFGPLLGATRAQSDEALERALTAARAFEAALQARGRALLEALTPGRGAVLVLSRPYHLDPGLCHRVSSEVQALGYPTLGIQALPRDRSWLTELFRQDLDAGAIADPFDTRDLHPEMDNSGGSERLWAARIAARHGALGVVDLSSFKCAQDAPTHAPIRRLLGAARVPHCTLHDLDETRPRTSLRLRLRTFLHAMRERGLGPWM
jgi:predicted CoA-substrate-specific enzyme activase